MMNQIPILPLVEKMQEYVPFLIDLDFKYDSVITTKPYDKKFIKHFCETVWVKLDECIELDSQILINQKFLFLKKKHHIRFKTRNQIQI